MFTTDERSLKLHSQIGLLSKDEMHQWIHDLALFLDGEEWNADRWEVISMLFSDRLGIEFLSPDEVEEDS